MADGYNVQEMTAHYIALAQNNPQLYQTFRDLIKKEYEGWADKLTKTRDEQYLDKNDHTQVRTVVVRNNKYADATKQNVADWFAQIEETADIMKGNDPAAAKKAFDKTCKTLEKAIQNTEKANAQEEKKGRQENTFTETYLTDLDDIEPEYYEGNSQEAVAYQGKEIVRQFGTKKTAAKIIEEIQDNVHGPNDITAEHIATIIAARQIANTVPGDKSRLKSTSIDPVTLQERVDKLLASEAFQDFLEENAVPYGENHYTFDPKMLTDGHGGKLESYFSLSLKGRKDLQDLSQDLYGRYQKTLDAEMAKRRDIDYSSYQTYKDYFEQNKGNVQLNPTVHAARMAAADALDKENPGAVFKKGNLDRKAIAIMQDPSFRILTALPGKQEMLLNGDGPGFEASVQEVKETCKSMLDKDGKFAHKDHSDIALNRLKNRVEAGEDVNSDLKDVVNSIESLKSGDKKTPRDVINTVGKIMEYQEKHMAEDTMGDKGRDMNDTLRVLHELTAGTKLNDVVQTQIDKVNSVRNVVPEQKNYLTKDFIAKEGVDAEKAAKGPAAGVPQA